MEHVKKTTAFFVAPSDGGFTKEETGKFLAILTDAAIASGIETFIVEATTGPSLLLIEQIVLRIESGANLKLGIVAGFKEVHTTFKEHDQKRYAWLLRRGRKLAPTRCSLKYLTNTSYRTFCEFGVTESSTFLTIHPVDKTEGIDFERTKSIYFNGIRVLVIDPNTLEIYEPVARKS